MTEWHRLTADETLTALGADSQGLGEQEIARRLAEYGHNELAEAGVKSPWRILAEQFTSVLIAVLIVAAIASAALGDYTDAIVILAIVLLNAGLGFRQEYRAEKTMSALRRLATPTVRVRRGGEVLEVPSRDLVPGDIVLIEAGNMVPADCRLTQSASLRAQESALTGESEPVEKTTDPLPQPEVPLADRLNLLFMGTAVSYGRGEAVVVATGMQTELGRIAGMIQSVHREPTPLQKRLAQLGRWLALAALVLVAIIFAQGLLRGEGVRVMFLAAISMAVAAVPEGLPAIVTVALSLGAQRMLKRNALIRKLPAVETLGSVTVICSDKTGTLTENRMTVVMLDVAGHEVDLVQEQRHGLQCAPARELVADAAVPAVASAANASAPVVAAATTAVPAAPAAILQDKPAVALLLAGAALCNDSALQTANVGPSAASSHPRFTAMGDPTEAALVIAAAQLGMFKPDVDRAFPRIDEIPFESERKLMTTVHDLPSEAPWGLEELQAHVRAQQAQRVAFTKGALESLLPLATAAWDGERLIALDESVRKRVQRSNDDLASRGMRVLAVGFRTLGAEDRGAEPQDLERELVLVGLIGMIDPARPEAREAVLTAVAAGIRPVMITGDQPLTATSIAEQVGVLGDPSGADGADGAGVPGAQAAASAQAGVLTGVDLARLSPQELRAAAATVSVYARVAPEQKLLIVQALQEQGHIVAMTGDGVNDAPALQKADIGVAMGITGTDVAKEAADMVLLDDNFATIVAAVKEGRTIYANLRKFVKYLMATNVGELAVMLVAPFLGMPLPLMPLQILWMNLVTDGLPGLALGFEPAERGIMQRPPYPPNESIFARGLGLHILWAGPLMGLIALATGWAYWRAGDESWQTMLFTVLTISQMFHVMAIRHDRESLFRGGLFSNRLMLAAVALTVLLQFALIYVPFLQNVFETRPLDASHILIAIALSSVIFWVIEARKWVVRRKTQA